MLLLPILLLAAQPQAARSPPVDQCAADRSFAAFRKGLLRTIARRDKAALMDVVAEDIATDFGGGSGRADFARMWRLDGGGPSPLWAELAEALRLGCARRGDAAVVPALAEGLPEWADPFETLIAVEPGSPLRAAPDADAAIVKRLDWDVLQAPDWNGESDWIEVATGDGRRGFVRRSEVRSPIDWRARFEKKGGRWRMTSLVAGD